jgi:hypothetical protein
MALNVGLDVSFDNLLDWKGKWEIAREVSGTKACFEKRMTLAVEFSAVVILRKFYMFFVSAKIYHSLCGAGTNGGSLRTGR